MWVGRRDVDGSGGTGMVLNMEFILLTGSVEHPMLSKGNILTVDPEICVLSSPFIRFISRGTRALRVWSTAEVGVCVWGAEVEVVVGRAIDC